MVRSDKNKSANTYEFLDERSDTTLCSQALAERLGMKDSKVQCSVTTVNGSKRQLSCRFGLNIQGMREPEPIHLDEVFTIAKLPDLADSILARMTTFATLISVSLN